MSQQASQAAGPEGGAERARRRGARGLADDLVMALRFFSRLPAGWGPHEKPDLGRIATALPLAALVMGLIPAAILVGGVAAGLPAYFAASLAVVAMVVVGGGMMEDSLADAADGLFGGSSPERRLEILKDSRHGTYGVAALCLFLVLRVSALGGMASMGAVEAGAVWLAANIAGRSAAMWTAVALPAARRDGIAASAGPLPLSRFLIGAVLAAILALLLAAPATGPLWVLPMLAVSGFVVLGWAALCRRLVGGQTGDLIGAGAGLAEIGALTVLLIAI